MRARFWGRHRRGLAALDVVLCAVVFLTIAAGAYVIWAGGLDSFFFILGNSVGWPLM